MAECLVCRVTHGGIQHLMKIGLTYDLRDEYLAEGYSEQDTAEFDRRDTIEAIERTLQDLGFRTERIGHARHLIKRLALGERWDMVFNIAEGLYGFGREALIPALLEAHRIPCVFSDSLVLVLTLHKGMTKHVVRDLGIPTPDFAVLETEADLEDVFLPYPLFAKPVAEGTGKGVTAASKIANRKELRQVCRSLFSAYTQPVILETFLPGREFTVGILGTGVEARAIGTLEVVLNDRAEQNVYSYVNKEYCEELVEYRLVTDEMAQHAQRVALAAWQGLGCRDADGIPNFIEVNPLAGLHPEHSDLPILCTQIGMSYRELLDAIMQSAMKRLKTEYDVLKKAA
jgi:D-alanine-D-alanine ligase